MANLHFQLSWYHQIPCYDMDRFWVPKALGICIAYFWAGDYLRISESGDLENTRQQFYLSRLTRKQQQQQQKNGIKNSEAQNYAE